jgi:hypothetical protein
MKQRLEMCARVTSFVVLVLLGGCSTTAIVERTQQVSETTQARSTAIQAGVAERASAEVPLYARVDRLWVSNRVVPKAFAQQLPSVFEKRFVYRSGEPVALASFAADLERATGTPVRLAGETVTRTVLLDIAGPARGALDAMSSKWGVVWEYVDGAILVTQGVTRLYTVARAGVDVGGNPGNRRDPYAEIESVVRAIAPNAKIAVSRTNNTVLVSAPPASISEIDRFMAIDQRNAARRVTLHWQLLNFTASSGGEAGLALNYLMARAGGAASLVTQGPGPGQGAGVLTLSRNQPGSPSNGSEYAISLLNKSGNAVVIREGFASVRHNDTQEFEATRTIYYASKSSLASIPATSGSNNGTTAIVNEQSSLEIGLSGKFGIAVFENENMDMSYEFAVKVLDQLRVQASATQYQEYPETSQRKARGRIPVSHGNTYIITTDSADSTNFDRRGMLPGAAAVLGGREAATQEKQQWLFLVTPIVTNGGV